MTYENMIPQAYSWLRAMSGGKLDQKQVTAGDQIIETLGFPVFANLIGFSYTTLGVTGQWDISKDGYDLIKSFEGLETTAYKDSAGIWTIGYGTIKYPNGTRVAGGDKITQAQAQSYLENDCKWVDACLDKHIKVKVSQKQFDALASFVYNVGETAFSTSTLLKKLNAGDFQGAGAQFDVWVNAGGRKVQGLVNRRAKEKALFLAG